MMTTMLASLALFLSLWSGGGAQHAPAVERGAPPPNVLVVVIDDMGRSDSDEFRSAGVMPNLDALARRGLELRCAVAAPSCGPARMEVFFSRYCFQDPGTGGETSPTGHEAPLSWPSLGHAAHLSGSPAGMFGKWHLGPSMTGGPREAVPLERGFDACSWIVLPPNDSSGGSIGFTYSSWVNATAPGGYGSPPKLRLTYLPKTIKNDLVAWTDAQTGSWVAVWTPLLVHGPFHNPPNDLVPPALRGSTTQRGKYREMCAAMDAQLGQVLAAVGPNTYVILLGDNGTAPQVAPIDPFTGLPYPSKTTTYDRGLLVPMIVAGPGIRARVDERLCSAVDVLPTLCAIQGSKVPIGLDGISLLATEGHKIVLAGDGAPGVPFSDFCARSARYKLRRWTDDGLLYQEALYDLEVDPNEHMPLPVTALPEVYAELREALYPRLP